MSEENVELIRRGVEAFNDGDDDAIADGITEDFEFIPYMAALVETTTYRGPDAFRKYREDAEEAWENIQVRVDEIRDLGIAQSLSARYAGAAEAAAWIREFHWRG